MQYLNKLPSGRLESAKRVTVKVDSGSIIFVDRNVYSVHSRLIGEQVEARLNAETVEGWYAGQKVEQMPWLRGRGKHRVDYRHIIDWIGPQARSIRSLDCYKRTRCFPLNSPPTLAASSHPR